MKGILPSGPFWLFCKALLGLSTLSLVFFMVGAVQGHSFADWYLVWNLFLAWIPFVISYALVSLLRQKLWSSWQCIGLSLAWLLFLPNSFYLVSDFIHLQDMPRNSVLFDSLVFTLFIINGLILGFASLYLIQLQLQRRISQLQTAAFVAAVLLSCSFAIYLGRDLRWNSWDILVSPAGIIFDISERVIRPLAHPQAFSVTLMFFAFLAGLYWVVWTIIRAVRKASVR
jgi:uncharacterized membrane protein